MTTTKQITELFRPLLERNPDLIQIGNFSLWLKPVRHVALRVAVDRTSEADQFRPRWSVESIFSAWPDFYRGPGSHVGDFLPDRHDPLPPEYWKNPDLMRQIHEMLWQRRLWRWSDDAIPAQFVKVVESEVLSMLRPLSEYGNFSLFHRENILPYGMVHPETQILIDIASGDLESAREKWQKLFHRYEVDLCAGVPVVQPLSSRERRRMIAQAPARSIAGGAKNTSPSVPHFLLETALPSLPFSTVGRPRTFGVRPTKRIGRRRRSRSRLDDRQAAQRLLAGVGIN